MPQGRRRHRSLIGGGAIFLTLLALSGQAQAAGPPILTDSWASLVGPNSARIHSRINPNGIFTTAHLEYASKADFDKSGFTGAKKVSLILGVGTSQITVNFPTLVGLAQATEYRYRVTASNSAGSPTSPTLSLTTRSPAGGALLADSRGWEMVSPIQKNGGQIEAPGQIAGGGVLQAAATGGQVTYSSTASFSGGAGAPPASQYLSNRQAGGWSTENVTAPLFSGTYDATDKGVPFQLFSTDLTRGLIWGGERCRGEGAEGCPVANPPLPGTDAPPGYENYYLREGTGFTALLGLQSAAFLTLEPAEFELRLIGATSDLSQVVLSSCAKLSANATEVALGEGCDPEEQNLYRWSAGSGLSLINLKPGDSAGTPGAALAAQAGAISTDGSRVYFSLEGDLFLRDGNQTKLVATEGEFQTASTNGATAFYTLPDEHLYRYLAAGAGTSTDLTPGGGVVGVLGASASGDVVYYQDASALKRWASGTTSTVAAGAEAASPTDWPAATGTARVSADGSKLLFLSKQPLSGYDNTDLGSGEVVSEVFLYDGALTCVSCNPTNQRPLGPSSIPGALANGTAVGSTHSYKPRALSANGRRVFFDTGDSLVLTDTNTNAPDVYQWEAQGEGSCTQSAGCISLISSGRDSGKASFIDASADGSDAFFLTAGSLVSTDPGSLDLYVARIGGGFPEPVPPLICEGDACQPLPSEPTDPTLTTRLSGPGNPAVRYPGQRCPKGKVPRRGRCVKKKGKGNERGRPAPHKGGRGR